MKKSWAVPDSFIEAAVAYTRAKDEKSALLNFNRVIQHPSGFLRGMAHYE
jgi:hypothetical protein